jgi:hypothetical protein
MFYASADLLRCPFMLFQKVKHKRMIVTRDRFQ